MDGNQNDNLLLIKALLDCISLVHVHCKWKWKSYCLVYNGGQHVDSKTIKEINSYINVECFYFILYTGINKHYF